MENMKNEFCKALIATTEKKDLSLYSQFLGEWDFIWKEISPDNQIVRSVKGEWLFALTMDGNAIQDLFICPSREERKLHPQPDQDYGTTIRFPYHDQSGKWEIIYISSYGIPVSKLIAQKVGDKIIQEGVNEDQTSLERWEWIFFNIKNDSFDWKYQYSHDAGSTWHDGVLLHATRKTK